jgi:exonuclease SbcC
MKIHSAQLRNVRQIKELNLDLSALLTVISGPNGVGKTTVQEAILAAMFQAKKEDRDTLISTFDPDSKPTVVLELSRGQSKAGIILTRTLTDDQGTWQEGPNLLKRKKQALEKIQEVLPISAQAAALLLWGRQGDLAAVIDNFPADGHTLLTAATIKGSGPDPKKIIKELEKEIENVRLGERGGQFVGALTQAKKQVKTLKEEWDKAKQAEDDLNKRRDLLETAKTQRDQIQKQLEELDGQTTKLAGLERLLEPALHDMKILADLEETQSDWEKLEDEITAAQKALAVLEKELEQLQSQFRFARDHELAQQIDCLQKKIAALEALENSRAELDKELQAKKRPDPADVDKFRNLKVRAKEAQDRMEASGVRYELSLASGRKTLRLTEDGGPEKEILLEAGKTHTDIVGRLVVEVDGLRFTAGGKEDISEHKNVWESTSGKIQDVCKEFAAEDETAFRALAEEKGKLAEDLKEKKNELKIIMGTGTLTGFRNERNQLEQARGENQVTLKDRETWAGKNPFPALHLGNQRSRKEGEIEQARDALLGKEEKRPSETEKLLHKTNLEAIRKKCRESVSAFRDADDQHREPGKILLKEIKTDLESKRQELANLSSASRKAEAQVAELQGQLKLMNPHRPIATIESDLENAEQVLHREQVLQDARALLKERIEEKMLSLAAHVPAALGRRITEHLEKFSAGTFCRVQMKPDLGLDQVGENGNHAGQWQPGQLSHGQRHQAALAVKIAVARALAETSGPVFVMLDDSLVSFDPNCRAATEKWLLDLTADEKLQIILLTCHSDWAADWKARCPDINHIELAREAKYYRDPPAIATAADLVKA